jgi:hypothetical protein
LVDVAALRRRKGDFPSAGLRGCLLLAVSTIIFSSARSSDPIILVTLIFDLGGVVIDWNPRHLYSKIFQSDVRRMEYFLKVICPLEWNELQDAGRSLSVATQERIEEFPEWRDEIAAYYGR